MERSHGPTHLARPIRLARVPHACRNACPDHTDSAQRLPAAADAAHCNPAAQSCWKSVREGSQPLNLACRRRACRCRRERGSCATAEDFISVNRGKRCGERRVHPPKVLKGQRHTSHRLHERSPLSCYHRCCVARRCAAAARGARQGCRGASPCGSSRAVTPAASASCLRARLHEAFSRPL